MVQNILRLFYLVFLLFRGKVIRVLNKYLFPKFEDKIIFNFTTRLNSKENYLYRKPASRYVIF